MLSLCCPHVGPIKVLLLPAGRTTWVDEGGTPRGQVLPCGGMIGVCATLFLEWGLCV
jgi:hypothetical protein